MQNSSDDAMEFVCYINMLMIEENPKAVKAISQACGDHGNM